MRIELIIRTKEIILILSMLKVFTIKFVFKISIFVKKITLRAYVFVHKLSIRKKNRRILVRTYIL